MIEGAKELPVANAVDTFKALSLGSQVRRFISMFSGEFVLMN